MSRRRPDFTAADSGDPVAGASVFADAAAASPASSPSTPSKSQRKRDMHDAQALGEALVALGPEKLATLALPERLFDAIVAARTITRHEARRRQMQFIGRLMRGVDLEPIRAVLAAQAAMPAAEKARMAALEHWRAALLDGDEALDRLMQAYPQLEREAWQRLIAEARQERRRPDVAPRHYRRLFRELKTLFETAESEQKERTER